MNYFDIITQFQMDSRPVSCEPFGNGHINSTFVVKTQSGKRYILQKLSEEAFKDVPALMENISGVTGYLDAKAKASGTVCHVLAPVKTKDGNTFIHVTDGTTSTDVAADTTDVTGVDAVADAIDMTGGAVVTDTRGTVASDGDAPAGYYRLTPFAENSISLEAPESDEDFYECAVAFGTFISDLADYPADTLHETIPNFHNTADRYRIFHETLKRAKADPKLSCRIGEATELIDFALAREKEAGILQEMRDSGELPTRVTHNDTKLNNVLLCAETRKLLYVIDLDTVMPGLSLYDYGDCIRFGASTATEDERDLSKVECDMHLFEVFTKGFISACKGLTDKEIEMLPMGAKIITLELGVRFLTDWLDGDKYFATKYSGQNLNRTRTQFKLVSDMERKWDEMRRIVNELSGN